MKRFRISVAGMMGVVVYLGFALAALSRPTPLWAEAWLTAVLAALAVSILGGILSRDNPRPFWVGFAIVGVGFVGLSLSPTFGPRLLPYGLVESHYRGLSYDPQSKDEIVWIFWNETFYKGRMLEPVIRGKYRMSLPNMSPGAYGNTAGTFASTDLRSISPEGYHQLCVSILTPVLGIAGGFVARRFGVREPAT